MVSGCSFLRRPVPRGDSKDNTQGSKREGETHRAERLIEREGEKRREARRKVMNEKRTEQKIDNDILLKCSTDSVVGLLAYHDR